MLKGKWLKADTLRNYGSVMVEVEDVDADALVMLMKIIHGKTRMVPRAVTLEMLAKIAVVVNLYQCYGAVEVFTDMWTAHSRKELPKAYSWTPRYGCAFHRYSGSRMSSTRSPEFP